MKFKKVLAFVMCATMLASSTSVLADQAPATGNAPIYSYDVESVIVPTDLKVALNPDKMEVTTDKSDPNAPVTTRDQIVSLNYGILNKSTDRKMITMDFTVTDSTGTIKFVKTDEEFAAVKEDEYAILLQVVPASEVDITAYDTQDATGAAGTDTKILNAPVDTTTGGIVATALEEIDKIDATKLANIKMTESTTGDEFATIVGTGKLGLVLEKALYTDDEIELGTTTTATGKISEVTKDCFGGFTFSGKMNEKADWAAIATTSNLDIKVEYGWEDAASDAELGVADAEVMSYSLTYDKSETTNNLAVDVNMAVTSAKLVKKDGSAITPTTLTSEHYSVSGNTLTFKESWVKSLGNAVREIEISDGTTTKTIVLTTQD